MSEGNFEAEYQGTSIDKFVPLSWALSSEMLDSYPGVAELVEAEKAAPVEVMRDLSLRAKIIDSCGLTCTFCHNEGTPVAVDNPSGEIAIRGITGRSGRISVFSADNGVDFIPGRMDPDDANYERSLSLLRRTLDLNELHLTGGEPTLHTKLSEIVQVARDAGYSVSMTSNGEMGGRRIEEAARNGLSKINFSIFGTTPEELAAVQNERFQDTVLAGKKISALHESIGEAAEAGIKVAANLVMSRPDHQERVIRLIDDFDPRLDLRVLPDLSNTQESAIAIYSLLAQLGAKPIVAQVEAGSSNARVRYALPNGRTIAFKQIRPARLEECGDCSLNNPEDCMEGFYGTRLYVDKYGGYKVGVCLQRMDLVSSIDEFAESDLSRQILELRETEYTKMQTLYKREQ